MITAISTKDSTVTATLTVTVNAKPVDPAPDPEQPDPVVPDEAKIADFLSKMEPIDDEDSWKGMTLQQKFAALKAAVASYNKLDVEKTDSRVVGKYATLLAVVREYNEAVAAPNAELQQAATISATAIAKAVSAAFAALIVLVKGLLWR